MGMLDDPGYNGYRHKELLEVLRDLVAAIRGETAPAESANPWEEANVFPPQAEGLSCTQGGFVYEEISDGLGSVKFRGITVFRFDCTIPAWYPDGTELKLQINKDIEVLVKCVKHA